MFIISNNNNNDFFKYCTDVCTIHFAYFPCVKKFFLYVVSLLSFGKRILKLKKDQLSNVEADMNLKSCYVDVHLTYKKKITVLILNITLKILI